MRIDIFTTANSWMNRHNTRFLAYLRSHGHDAAIVSSLDQIHDGDVMFCLGCWELIPPSHLSRHKHNLGVHASDLPHGKGWSPCSWQILEGKNSIPISLFEVQNKVDSGAIYLQRHLELTGDELLDEWQDKLGEKIIDMSIEMIDRYDSLIASGRQQEGIESFYARRTPNDSRLDIAKSIDEQFNLLRIVDNELYPAFFEKNGVRYVLQIAKSKSLS